MVWAWSAYWVDFSTVTSGLQLAEYSGTEKVSEDYILFTYTDGFGDVPYEVSDFLENNPSIKGVIASGDTGYGEAYCLADDKISEDYHVPCLYKVENDGTDEDVEAIKELL